MNFERYYTISHVFNIALNYRFIFDTNFSINVMVFSVCGNVSYLVYGTLKEEHSFLEFL